MGVQRLDAPDRNFKGWMATYQHRGVWTRRYFSDERFGGSEAAQKAAQAFHDTDADLRREAISLARRLRSRRNSKAGVVGVTRVARSTGPASWMAYWTDPEGKRRYKRFSVRIHGEENALRLAVETRMANTQPDIERLSELLQQLKLSSSQPPPVSGKYKR